MRITSFIAASALLVSAPAAVAQEYVDFKSPADGFSIVFPVQPKVTESTFTTQNGSVLPSRILAADTSNAQHAAAGFGARQQVALRIEGQHPNVRFVAVVEEFAFALWRHGQYLPFVARSYIERAVGTEQQIPDVLCFRV